MDRAGNLWLTSENGFYRFDPNTETNQPIRLLRPQGSDTATEASLEDQDGVIWVASHDGLFRFDPEIANVTLYTTKDGLPTNFLVGILQDETGDLWISTKKGLSRFSPAAETFRNYDAFDGLQGNEFNTRIVAQANDGRMFFGGTNGLTAFYPQAIVDSTYQPPVILDDFDLFNQSVHPGDNSPLSIPIWLTDNLTLDYDQNFLSFEFSVLNYAFGDNNHYRYRLEGLETAWNETDSSRRFATYTNLHAGDYIFRVQATNRDGVWSEHEVALKLTVLPPWWETTWFRLGIVLLLGIIVVGGYQWRVRQIARHNRALRQEVDRQTHALQVRTQELQTSENQLREAKEAAESANDAKGIFLANMSHELRSPLNAILGFAQVTKGNRTLPHDVQENLRVIINSGEHLLALINQVLDLSKIEAGQMTLLETGFDLYRLLDDLEDMFILAADDKGLRLNFEYAGDVPQYIFADMTKLRQTLINLVSNALKFTKKGKITVRVKKLDGAGDFDLASLRLKFEVEDTGPGIPTDELSMLFDAFAQASTARKAQEGTGLGLTISRNFVRLMGGDIRVRSDVGKGTTFTFDISCRVASEVSIQSGNLEQQVVGLAPNQPRFRIMVVDDKWTNRQLIVKLLEPLGFEMLEAENGADAVELAQTFQPHLIWMDMRMPIMDGMEATRRLKALPLGKSTKIIALTASVFDEERVKVLAAGCDDLVRKPIHADRIFEVLSKHTGAQYIYADIVAEQTLSTLYLLSSDEMKTALSTIPPELVVRLSEAIVLGDMAVIERSISEVRGYHTALAGTLHKMAQRFQFEELLELLREEERR